MKEYIQPRIRVVFIEGNPFLDDAVSAINQPGEGEQLSNEVTFESPTPRSVWDE